ncbi:MAG TPA: hypothetical protein VGE33_11040 [Thermomonas sp.]
MTQSPRFSRKTLNVAQVHSNTSLEIIEITSDKLRIILNDHIKRTEKINEWQTALGILMATVAALVTTEFKTTFGVDGGIWKAIFIIAAVASVVWLFKAVIRVFRAESIDQLISRIKNEPQV